MAVALALSPKKLLETRLALREVPPLSFSSSLLRSSLELSDQQVYEP